MPPLPPVVGLPALELSVIDSKSLGVPWVALNASDSFNGLCSKVCQLTTSNATVMTTDLAGLKLQNLDVTGCSVGELVLKITAMSASVTRFARVVLFEPSTAVLTQCVYYLDKVARSVHRSRHGAPRPHTMFADPFFVN